VALNSFTQLFGGLGRGVKIRLRHKVLKFPRSYK
jgi:hypothetical protein